MEQTNLPVVAKKMWNIVRAMFILLRKGIMSKNKLMADLNLMMKRGKIASKAIHNLMFHHNNAHVSYAPREYEFSCSNSPVFFKKRKSKHHNVFHNHDMERKALEMLNADLVMSPAFWVSSEAPSPALPGFGRSPAPVRQLRITDSPFPLRDVDEDCHVDEAAEEFISKFYKNLRRQN